MKNVLTANAGVTRLFGLLLAAAGSAQSLAQTDIPPTLVGSYDLTMQASNSASPIPDGTGPIRIEISSEGLLCADGVPFGGYSAQHSSSGRIVWINEVANLEFSINPGGNFAGISVGSATGASYGALVGTKINNVPETCGQLALHNSFFELAETAYPTQFPASIFVFTQSNETADFRYYPSTNLYLSVEDTGQVSVSGGEFGAGRLLGDVQDILAAGTFELSEDDGGGEPLNPTADPYYVSTYTLDLTEAAPFSPVPDGTTLTFVLMPDYTLCVGETILSPTFRGAFLGGVTWYNPEARYFYELEPVPIAERPDGANTGSFHFFHTSGLRYGVFTGERTALSTECPDALGDNPDLPEIDLMLSLAEQYHPELFPGGPQTFNQRVNGSVYRYYRSTDIMVRVNARQVYASGGTFGSAESYIGSLENVITALRNLALPVSIPASLTGTWTTTFTAEGPYVQIPDQTAMDLSIDQNGSLCLDGVVLMNPYLDPANPNIIRWENIDGGFLLELDIAAATAESMAITMTSNQGLMLGTMEGTKALLFPVCSGVLGNGVNLAAAQELFDLGEQYLREYFPPSALTYSRFEGNRLLRYYPATGVMLALENGNVDISGGAFGLQPRRFGTVQDLTAMLLERFNLGQLRNVSLTVDGTVVMRMSNTAPLARPIQITRPETSAPADTERDTLIQVVEQVLGSEIRGSNDYQFTMVSDNANELIFDVLISNEVSASLVRIRREYDLRFSYARR